MKKGENKMTTLVPQLLFSEKIQFRKGEKIDWFYDEEVLHQQVDKFISILSKLEQTEGSAVAWFLIDNQINKKQYPVIEKHIEDYLSFYFEDSWEPNVYLIPNQDSYTIDQVIIHISKLVHKLSLHYPFNAFAQIVGFGNPIVAHALFMEGIRQFEDRYVSIYEQNHAIEVIETNVKPTLANWSKEFRDFINDHDYQGALEIMKDVKEDEAVKGMRSMLKMLIDRMNFSFSESNAHLKDALGYVKKEEALAKAENDLASLLTVDKKVRDLSLIQELYRHIDIYLETDDMTSFLIRLYRAREAVLLFLLEHAQTTPFPVKKTKNGNVYKIVDELEEKYDSWDVDGYYGAYFYLKSANLAHALNERNQSFIGHDRSGIELEKVWKSYFGARTHITKAKRRFMLDTTIMLRDLGVQPDNHIEDIELYLLELAEELEHRKELTSEHSLSSFLAGY